MYRWRDEKSEVRLVGLQAEASLIPRMSDHRFLSNLTHNSTKSCLYRFAEHLCSVYKTRNTGLDLYVSGTIIHQLTRHERHVEICTCF